MYTECIETGSLAAYARLRLDPHAQVEIREFAGAVAWAALRADVSYYMILT
jgi:thymidylate synthase ThyX